MSILAQCVQPGTGFELPLLQAILAHFDLQGGLIGKGKNRCAVIQGDGANLEIVFVQ